MIEEKTRLMVDGHVHIYDCYDLEKFFAIAEKYLNHFYHFLYSNGSTFEKIILLTEGKSNDFFLQFKEKGEFPNSSGYKFLETEEKESIILLKNDQRICYLLKGRQIITRENLEVLTIASTQTIRDGLPIETVIDQIIKEKNLAVLPWGFGKWFFKRGKIIKNLIDTHSSPYLLIADNSGRPLFWPSPQLFKRAKNKKTYLISGSDPLPFKDEISKVGSYGFSVECDFNKDKPADSLRNTLISPDAMIDLFGIRDNFFSFFKRQAKIISRKYLRR